MYDPWLGRFNSVDPLADSAVSWNPYHYVRNNPLNRVDPTGLTDYELNEKGEVVNTIENEDADNIYMVDQDGARIDGQSISFEFGTITAVKNPTITTGKGEKSLTILEVNGDQNATSLFEFLGNQETVEWTHAKIGTERSARNIVGTSHDEASTPVGHYLRLTNYTLREVNHNHPSPSNLPSSGDVSAASFYHSNNPNTKLQVYSKQNGYRLYNENSTSYTVLKDQNGNFIGVMPDY
jgi:hypothetical protein